ASGIYVNAWGWGPRKGLAAGLADRPRLSRPARRRCAVPAFRYALRAMSFAISHLAVVTKRLARGVLRFQEAAENNVDGQTYQAVLQIQAENCQCLITNVLLTA